MKADYMRSLERMDENLWLMENSLREIRIRMKIVVIIVLLLIFLLVLVLVGEIWIFINGP